MDGEIKQQTERAKRYSRKGVVFRRDDFVFLSDVVITVRRPSRLYLGSFVGPRDDDDDDDTHTCRVVVKKIKKKKKNSETPASADRLVTGGGSGASPVRVFTWFAYGVRRDASSDDDLWSDRTTTPPVA